MTSPSADLSHGLAYTNQRLDRMMAQRADLQFLAAEAAAQARYLLFAADAPLLAAGTPPRALLERAEADAAGPCRHRIYLGRFDGTPVFAAEMSPLPDTGEPPGLQAADLRGLAVEGALEPGELALVGLARSFLNWHRRHSFCGSCGARTEMRLGGWRRDCPACAAQHFPRLDPVAIMLITDGERALLGRQPRFAAGSYSCLAGFIEPGETIEDAVRREIFEEAGVRVGAVSYVMSQPWPFPSSLMIGCRGDALSTGIIMDADELEDVRWFSRDEVRMMLERTHPGGLITPPPVAIANALMRHFVEN